MDGEGNQDIAIFFEVEAVQALKFAIFINKVKSNKDIGQVFLNQLSQRFRGL